MYKLNSIMIKKSVSPLILPNAPIIKPVNMLPSLNMQKLQLEPLKKVKMSFKLYNNKQI